MIEKKMRSDKKKNLADVLSEAIKNPLKSQENIAKDLWLWESSVSRAFQEMEENGSIKKIPEIRDICKDDFKIVKLTQKETIRRLTDPEKETFSDIIRAWAESTKRYAIFKGDITDEAGGLKSTLTMDVLANMTINEINEYKKKLLEN